MKIFVVIKTNPKDFRESSVFGAFENCDEALDYVNALNDDENDPFVYHFEKCQLKLREI